jgi:hypothetical protein
MLGRRHRDTGAYSRGIVTVTGSGWRDSSPRTPADQLLRRWIRISRRHVSLAFGCGCGMSSHVSGEDFAQDLIDFLRYRHPGLVSHQSLTALMQEAGAAQLAAAAAKEPTEPGAWDVLMSDLERSIAAWERSTGGLRSD